MLSSMLSKSFIPYLLNIVLFIPFGFFVSGFIKDGHSLRKTTCAGFFFSLLIETSQLLNNRSTDIDDLILNTIGALIGGVIVHFFLKNTKEENYSDTFSQVELPIYILVMFLGRFFLYNELGFVQLFYF